MLPRALTALDAGVFVHFQMIDADFVEQPIDGAQRAERLTEKAEDKNKAVSPASASHGGDLYEK